MIAVVGRGFNGEGAIQSFGINTFAGNILGFEGKLDNTVLLSANAGSLSIGGTVTLRDVQMEVNGAGDLSIAGGIQGATAVDGLVNGFEQRFYDQALGSAANKFRGFTGHDSPDPQHLDGAV